MSYLENRSQFVQYKKCDPEVLTVCCVVYNFFWGKSRIENVSIKINKVTINRVEATKFLGVLIDDKLTWKHHISLLKSKLSKCCAVMYKTSFLIDRRGMHILH